MLDLSPSPPINLEAETRRLAELATHGAALAELIERDKELRAEKEAVLASGAFQPRSRRPRVRPRERGSS